jgi:hypothetical protein
MMFDFIHETESQTLLVEVNFFNFLEDDEFDCNFVVIGEDGKEVGEESYCYDVIIDEIQSKALEINDEI